jgi:hypothetical protein
VSAISVSTCLKKKKEKEKEKKSSIAHVQKYNNQVPITGFEPVTSSFPSRWLLRNSQKSLLVMRSTPELNGLLGFRRGPAAL